MLFLHRVHRIRLAQPNVLKLCGAQEKLSISHSHVARNYSIKENRCIWDRRIWQRRSLKEATSDVLRQLWLSSDTELSRRMFFTYFISSFSHQFEDLIKGLVEVWDTYVHPCMLSQYFEHGALCRKDKQSFIKYTEKCKQKGTIKRKILPTGDF